MYASQIVVCCTQVKSRQICIAPLKKSALHECYVKQYKMFYINQRNALQELKKKFTNIMRIIKSIKEEQNKIK